MTIAVQLKNLPTEVADVRNFLSSAFPNLDFSSPAYIDINTGYVTHFVKSKNSLEEGTIKIIHHTDYKDFFILKTQNTDEWSTLTLNELFKFLQAI